MDFLAPIDESDDVDLDLTVEQDCESVELNNSKVLGESSKTKNTKKQMKSPVWRFFTMVEGLDNEGRQRAKCNACDTSYACGGKQYRTSSLRRHLGVCKKVKFGDVVEMLVEMQRKLKSSKVNDLVSREMCAQLIIKRDLPFKFAEFEELTTWLQYLSPDYIPITRNTAKADVMRIYKREKEKIKIQMANTPCRISLTSNLWTSINTEGYITLTAHYVDKNWKLNSKILNFCHMPPPHTGFELCKRISEFLTDWGIEKKVFTITLDNASANDVMQQTLKTQLNLQNWLLCNGEFFHVRCSAHVLNLIVQEGLKVASRALQKIRESIKHIKGSESRMVKFKQCIDNVGYIDVSSGLVTDVPTRWNSTYLMLKSALKYQRAFENLHGYDSNYTSNPSNEEWVRLEKISKFLLPFYEITTLMSETSYPTSNLYFLQIWKIQRLLIDNQKEVDEVIKKMAESMILKFEKYWDEYSVVLAFGAVLDPRIKLDSLGYCYKMIDPLNWVLKLENIKLKLYKLFAEYSISSSNASSTPPSASSTMSTEPSLFDEIRLGRQQSSITKRNGQSQLDMYLDEPALDLDYTEHLDVLQWWKNIRIKFPELSVMARDLLSIPITTVASESSFSIGSKVLNKYRNRLLSENIEALLCSRNWLHAFDDDGNDDDNEDEKKWSNLF